MNPAIRDRQKRLDEFKTSSRKNAKERIEKLNKETDSTPAQRLLRAVKSHSDKRVILSVFEPKYIIDVDDADIGTIGLLYDIEYINSDWLFLSQRLDLQHLENGYYYYASNFELIDKYKNQNFSAYPKANKITLWQAIFGLKEYIFNTYAPDIVEHFVAATYASWEKRLALYKKYLRPKGYVYVVDKKTNAFHLVKEHIYTRLKWDEYENFEL